MDLSLCVPSYLRFLDHFIDSFLVLCKLKLILFFGVTDFILPFLRFSFTFITNHVALFLPGQLLICRPLKNSWYIKSLTFIIIILVCYKFIVSYLSTKRNIIGHTSKITICPPQKSWGVLVVMFFFFFNWFVFCEVGLWVGFVWLDFCFVLVWKCIPLNCSFQLLSVAEDILDVNLKSINFKD